MKREYKGAIFLGVVLLGYILTFFIKPLSIKKALLMSTSIGYRILPVLALVLIIMTATNYFANNKRIKQQLQQKNSAKKWLLTIGAGILSSGPIYIWYPLLQQAKQKGLQAKYICAFIYTRAIKLPFIPILIAYFGFMYTTTLIFFLILFSAIQGIILEKILQPKNKLKN